MRDADELDAERANRDALPRLDGLQPIAGIDAVLFELGLHEGECHRRAVHRSVKQLEDVWDGTDVIFVPVGQNQRLDVVAPRFDKAHVRDDQIHAELVGLGEHDTGIDEDRRVLPGHRHHVHTELAEAAQGDDFESRWRHDGHSGLIHSGLASRLDCPNHIADPGRTARWGSTHFRNVDISRQERPIPSRGQRDPIALKAKSRQYNDSGKFIAHLREPGDVLERQRRRPAVEAGFLKDIYDECPRCATGFSASQCLPALKEQVAADHSLEDLCGSDVHEI